MNQTNQPFEYRTVGLDFLITVLSFSLYIKIYLYFQFKIMSNVSPILKFPVSQILERVCCPLCHPESPNLQVALMFLITTTA